MRLCDIKLIIKKKLNTDECMKEPLSIYDGHNLKFIIFQSIVNQFSLHWSGQKVTAPFCRLGRFSGKEEFDSQRFEPMGCGRKLD